MKKTSADHLATKNDLNNLKKGIDKRMDGMEKRMDGMEKRMATKNDLSSLEQRVNQKIWRLEDQIDGVKVDFEQKFTRFKSDILDGVDKVYKEVVAMREEQTIHQGVHDRTEERLITLESSTKA